MLACEAGPVRAVVVRPIARKQAVAMVAAHAVERTLFRGLARDHAGVHALGGLAALDLRPELATPITLRAGLPEVDRLQRRARAGPTHT